MLLACGDAVTDVKDRLELIADRYGYPEALVSVMPTVMLVSARPAGRVRIGKPIGLLDTRLDQAAAAIALTEQIVGSDLTPEDGRLRLGQVIDSPRRFGPAARVGGHVLLTVGLALILEPKARIVVLAGLFGLLVGALKLTAYRRQVRLEFLLPVLCAGLVSALSFVLLPNDPAAQPIGALVPPLITFLPGGLLTTALYDLAAGEVVTGASRFVAGLLQLLMLALGIVIGAQLAGLPAVELTRQASNTLGVWAPWLGVLLFGLGVFVFFSGPSGSLLWLLVVLYAAWLSEILGHLVLSAELTGFVGGLIVFPIAVAVQQARGAPPAFVTFMPAFWLLVPGALGLAGVTNIVGEHHQAGVHDFTAALVSIAAIGLGVLAGATLVEWIRSRRGRDLVAGVG